MQRLEVRALLSPFMGFRGEEPPPAAPGDILVDEDLEEDAFLRALEEKLQQRMSDLGASSPSGSASVFLVLRVAQVDTLARRLHDALEPKRDVDTGVIQAWTIQPQLQRKVKLSSHIQVLKLSTILREVRRLRLHHSNSGVLDGSSGKRTAPIELDIFPSLRVVEILHSQASLLRNVHFFARQLQAMHIEHTRMQSLRDLLAPSPPSSTELVDTAPWRRLQTLELNCCDLPDVDVSVNLLTAVKTLDLGWNEIRTFQCELTTSTLENLSLCHNLLPSIPPIQSLKYLRTLDLSINQIHSLTGLEALQMLKSLDVSHNLIDSISEVEKLTELPSLRRLKLSHNPIARRADYRREVFFFLGSELELDAQPWTTGELESMKGRRSLRVSELLIAAVDDREAAEIAELVFPAAGGMKLNETQPSHKLVMDYPALPPIRGVTPQFVGIQDPPQSSLLRQYIRQQVVGGGVSEDGDSIAGSSVRRETTAPHLSSEMAGKQTTNDESSVDNGSRRGVQTVDDYFRVKSDSIASAAIVEENEQDFSSDEDSDDSSQASRKRSRKYTASDFMRDFEEEEARLLEDSVASSTDARATLSAPSASFPRSDFRGPNDIRVLLNADEAAKHDLHFGIDGLAATLQVKTRGWIETLFTPDHDPSQLTIRRRLQDVLAIGALIEPSGRPSILSLSFRCKAPLKLTTVTYKIDELELLQQLLDTTLNQLHAAAPTQPSVCSCVHCGALSMYSREYLTHPSGVTQTFSSAALASSPDGCLVVYACLLCSSCNVRELTVEKLVAICVSKGVQTAVKSDGSADAALSHLELDGFYIEEAAIDPSMRVGVAETVMISSNGIRELSLSRGDSHDPLRTADEIASDAWNDAIDLGVAPREPSSGSAA